MVNSCAHKHIWNVHMFAHNKVLATDLTICVYYLQLYSYDFLDLSTLHSTFWLLYICLSVCLLSLSPTYIIFGLSTWTAKLWFSNQFDLNTLYRSLCILATAYLSVCLSVVIVIN